MPVWWPLPSRRPRAARAARVGATRTIAKIRRQGERRTVRAVVVPHYFLVVGSGGQVATHPVATHPRPPGRIIGPALAAAPILCNISKYFKIISHNFDINKSGHIFIFL